MPLKQILFSIATVAVLAMVAPSAAAQSQSDDDRPVRAARDSKWDLFVGPYGWLTGVAGTVVTDGNETEIEVPFEEFFENTKAGLMLYFEARRNKLFVAFDGTWATLGGEMDGQLLDLDIEIRQRIYDIRVGYEVHNTELGDVIRKKKFDWQRRGVIDVFVGGRYFRTEPVITITGLSELERELSGVDSRIDPFVGLRIGWDMSYRWMIGFHGDVGGFGIGDAAQLSWQATGELGFRLSRRVTIFGGYRFLSFDTVTGEGENRNGTDLQQEGMIIGAGISF